MPLLHEDATQTMPPYELPANKTQSGIISRSSPNGTAENFNEIRFEYFREDATLFEAFKSGQIDLRTEDNPALWAQAA